MADTRRTLNMVAVAYVRVSTSGQVEDGVSLEAQRAKIAAWAKLHDEDEVVFYEDAGLSGSSMDQRPGLKEALQKACEQKAILVVYSLSRLARSTRDTLQISDRLAKAGAELVSLSEKIDTTSAAGKMVFRMLAVLAEFERDQISERTKTAMTHLRRSGRRISRFAPYGWNFDTYGDQLLPTPVEQAVVARVRALREAKMSYREIARVLDSERIPTKQQSSCWSAKVVRHLAMRAAA